MASSTRSTVLCLLAFLIGSAAEPCQGDSTCVEITAADVMQGSALLQVKWIPTKDDGEVLPLAEAPTKEAPTKEAPMKDAPTLGRHAEAPSNDYDEAVTLAPTEEDGEVLPLAEAPTKEAPTKGAPTKDAPTLGRHAEAPLNDYDEAVTLAPTEDDGEVLPLAEAPTKEAPTKEAPTKDAPILVSLAEAPTKDDGDVVTLGEEKDKASSCMQLEIQEAYKKLHAATECASDSDSEDKQDPIAGNNNDGYYDQSGAWRPGKPPGASGSTSASDPYSASLDSVGFLAVTSTCCAWKMEVFFTRLLESMGYRICSTPHLQGLMHWFTCVPSMDYNYILQIIANGNEHGCKFWAKEGETCMALVGTKCDNPCKP